MSEGTFLHVTAHMFYRKKISKCCSPKAENVPTPTNAYVNLKMTRTRTTSPASSNNPVQGEDNVYHALQSRNEADHLYGAIEGTSTSTPGQVEQTEVTVNPYQTLKRAAGDPDHIYGEIEATTDGSSDIKSPSAVDITVEDSYEIPDVHNAPTGQQYILQAKSKDESYEIPELHI